MQGPNANQNEPLPALSSCHYIPRCLFGSGGIEVATFQFRPLFGHWGIEVVHAEFRAIEVATWQIAAFITSEPRSFDICLGSGGSRSQPGKLRPPFGFRGIELVTCQVPISV
jgi:hypothetical protein